jgi:hypothetical protein
MRLQLRAQTASNLPTRSRFQLVEQIDLREKNDVFSKGQRHDPRGKFRKEREQLQ